MLTLPRFCFLILMVMGIALCWVHQQVKLVTTSYQIAQKERALMELEWTCSRLRYHVLTLESPIQLDQRLNQAAAKFTFRDPVRVVRAKELPKTYAHSSTVSGARGLWDFLMRTAEAKQNER